MTSGKLLEHRQPISKGRVFDKQLKIVPEALFSMNALVSNPSIPKGAWMPETQRQVRGTTPNSFDTALKAWANQD